MVGQDFIPHPRAAATPSEEEAKQMKESQMSDDHDEQVEALTSVLPKPADVPLRLEPAEFEKVESSLQ